MVETERMLNVGTKVTLKFLGEVTVREPSLETLLLLAKDLVLIVQTFSQVTGGLTATAVMGVMLADPDLAATVRKLAAAMTARPVEDFEDLGFSDWLRLIDAAKSVVDWKEVQDLFFRVVPQDQLRSLLAKKEKPQPTPLTTP